MVIDARHRLATVKQLPYDAEIEYLESTGTQWIDSRINFDSDVGFSIVGKMSAIQPAVDLPSMIGSLDSNFDWFYLIWCDSTVYVDIAEINFDVFVSLSTNKLFSASVNYLNDKTITTKEIESGNIQTKSINILGKQKTIGLFCSIGDSGAENFSSSTIHSIKISKGNDVIMDAIPVRFTNELGQSEGAMYDKVSGQLFRNQGSGEFVMGPDVIPYDAEVEFLESPGGDTKIETGIYHNLENTVRFKIRLPNTTNAWANAYSAYVNEDSATTRIIRNNKHTNSILVFHGGKAGGGGTNVNYNAVIGNNTTQVYEGYTSIGEGAIKYIDSETLYKFSLSQPLVTTLQTPMILLGSPAAGGRIYYFSIDNQCDFIPVRIGTTGYMYDRANPKGGPLGNGLYPNSGSGDFILGKDVAYPKKKFEVTYRRPQIWIKPPTARDYISDGLIAMWDGIENAGWGMHDGTTQQWIDLMGNELPIIPSQSGNNGFKWTDYGVYNFTYQAYQSTSITRDYTRNGVTFEVTSPDGPFYDGNNRVISYNFIGVSTIQSNNYYIFKTFGKNGDTLSKASIYSAVRNCRTMSLSVNSDGIGIAYFNGGDFTAPMNKNTKLSLSGEARIIIGTGNGNIHQPLINSLRLYSRALTADEIAHNYAIDKIRFNLP